MGILVLKGSELEEILDNYHPDYTCIDMHYEYVGVDHDLWEFVAIIKHIADNKFFKVNWFDNYSCNWSELGLDDDYFELIEVTPKQIMTTIYE